VDSLAHMPTIEAMTEPIPAGGEESRRGNSRTLRADCSDYHDGRQLLDEQLPEGWRLLWMRMVPD